jgi:hypothetical protein
MVNGRRDGPSAVDLTIDVENYNRVFNMLNLQITSCTTSFIY